MLEVTPSEARQGRVSLHRLLALLEIVLVAVSGTVAVWFLFGAAGLSSPQILDSTPLLFLFMTCEATVTLLVLRVLLGLRGESLATLGTRWRSPELWLGFSSVPLLFASTFLVGILFRALFPRYVSQANPLLDLVQGAGDLAFFVVSSIYVGGIKEEIQRAFVLHRFESDLGPLFAALGGRWLKRPIDGGRVGLLTGLLVWSLFFAVGHAVQGVDNAVGAGVLGLLFGLLYLWRRNLLAPVVAHASYDITTLLVYFFFYR